MAYSGIPALCSPRAPDHQLQGCTEFLKKLTHLGILPSIWIPVLQFFCPQSNSPFPSLDPKTAPATEKHRAVWVGPTNPSQPSLL